MAALVCVWVILTAGQVGAGERFYFTPARVEIAKENIKRHGWARAVFDSLLVEAGKASRVADEDLQGWIPPYTPLRPVDCPVCGSSWLGYIWGWDARDPDVLVCRRCGARISAGDYPSNDTLRVRDPSGVVRTMPAYRDSSGKTYFILERIAYQKLTHLGSWLEALGAVYALTGEERYAQAVRKFLLRLAEVYPSYALHDWYHFGTKPWPRAGKISGWNYEDAILIVRCGKAYDAIRNSRVWRQGEKEKVKRGLFRTAAEFLTELRPDQGIVNAIPFRYAGVAFAGRILEDPEVMRWVLDDELGVVTFLRSHWFPDGTWCERSPSYGLMVLRTFHEVVDALADYADPPWYTGSDRIDHFDLRKVRRLKEVYEQPFRILYPDGTLPPFDDSHVGERPPFWLADAGYGWFRSEQSLRNLAVALRDSLLRRGNLFSLFHRPPDAPERLEELLAHPRSTADSSYRSDYLGVVVLRGRAWGRPAMLTLQYGGIHGGHDHHDKLDLTLFACGREMLSDLGYVFWAHPQRFVWMRRSLAHNTVTVDGINQALTGGRLILNRSEGDVQVVEADARETYSGITGVFDRQLVWITTGPSLCILDVFRVRGGRLRDWSVHAETAELNLPGVRFTPAELQGRDYAYEHLQNVRLAQSQGSFTAEWTWSDPPRAKLRLTLLTPSPVRVYLTEAPAERRSDQRGRRLPYLIVRDDEGEGTTFVAVWEPFVEKPALADVRLRRHGELTKEWPVEVEFRYRTGERVIVATALEDDPGCSSTIEGRTIPWRGRVGVLRWRASGNVEEHWFRAYSE